MPITVRRQCLQSLSDQDFDSEAGSVQVQLLKLLFDAQRPIATDSANTFADGMACRQPPAESLEIVLAGASRIVRVSEDEIAAAIRHLYTDTHNLAEGSGAASLAALLKESRDSDYRKAGVVLCGGNIDMKLFAQVLNGQTPVV